MMHYLLPAFFVVVLVLCSGLISGAEVAFFSLKASELEKIKSRRQRSLKLIGELIARPRHLLATLLIVNTFINIAVIILTSYLMMIILGGRVSEAVTFLIEVVLITFMLVLFGEVIPKVYANKHYLRFATFMAYPVFWLGKICYPLAHSLVNTSRWIEKRLAHVSPAVSAEEIDHAIELSTDSRSNGNEIRLLKGVVKFGNTSVKQIMRSRMDIVALDTELDFEQMLKHVRDSGYSRIPVYRENLDHIIGVLYTKDLLAHLSPPQGWRWQELIRKPMFVPEGKMIDDLMKDIQEKRMHMAIVVDEYGGTAGLVTLEDVMEEVVGEIRDEFDERHEFYMKQVEANTFLLDGKTLINDVCRMVGINPATFDDVRGDADSIAGLYLEKAGKIPLVGDALAVKNYRLTVTKMEQHRLSEIKLEKLPATNP